MKTCIAWLLFTTICCIETIAQIKTELIKNEYFQVIIPSDWVNPFIMRQQINEDIFTKDHQYMSFFKDDRHTFIMKRNARINTSIHIMHIIRYHKPNMGNITIDSVIRWTNTQENVIRSPIIYNHPKYDVKACLLTWQNKDKVKQYSYMWYMQCRNSVYLFEYSPFNCDPNQTIIEQMNNIILSFKEVDQSIS